MQPLALAEPISTVGQPCTTTPPCVVGSPIRAASLLPMSTVGSPFAILSTAGTHLAESPTRAAGRKPMRTVVSPWITGPPTCGGGSTLGQVWLSVMRAAGGMAVAPLSKEEIERGAGCQGRPARPGRVRGLRPYARDARYPQQGRGDDVGSARGSTSRDRHAPLRPSLCHARSSL